MLFNMIHGIKRQFEEITGKEARSIIEIKEGITNENYLINDAYVLRIPQKDHDPLINYKLENEVYTKIEPLHFSEKIVYFDPKTGVKLSKFVHKTRFYVKTPTNEQIRDVSKTLKKLHNQNIKVSKKYNAIDKLEYYKKYVDSAELLDEKYENLVVSQYKKILANEKLCLCHNDLVHHNLLFKFSGGLILIDWEYAAMNSPLFDLASFISENNLSDEQKEFFIKDYYGYRYTKIKQKRVNSFIAFLDILFYYWALHYYKKRRLKIYFDIAIEKLNHIKNTMIESGSYYKF